MATKTKYPRVYADPQQQARYVKLRQAGNSDAFAQMLTEQRPPGIKGENARFLNGRQNGEDIEDMSPLTRKKLLENAKKAGVSVQGKRYISQLARRGVPCDPLALVSDLDDVKARARAMGRQVCTMEQAQDMDYQGSPPRSVALAEDIVQEEVAKRIAKDPSLKKVPKAKIREQVIDKHALKRKART